MAKNKKTNKDTSAPEPVKGLPVHGLYGVALLFVSVSIGYANYVVYFGTEGTMPKIMLVPSTLAVAAFLVYKALK